MSSSATAVLAVVVDAARSGRGCGGVKIVIFAIKVFFVSPVIHGCGGGGRDPRRGDRVSACGPPRR